MITLLAVLGVLFVLDQAWQIHLDTRDAREDIEFVEACYWLDAVKAT